MENGEENFSMKIPRSGSGISTSAVMMFIYQNRARFNQQMMLI